MTRSVFNHRRLTSTTVLAEILADSPRVLLKHDDASGTVLDYSGNGFNGTPSGTVTYAQSPLFTSAVQSIEYTDPTIANRGGLTLSNSAFSPGAGDFAVETWIYLASVSTGSAITYWEAGNNTIWRDASIRGSKVAMSVNGGSVSGTSALTNHQIYHVVVSYDSGANTVSFYVNGAADGTATPSAPSAAATTFLGINLTSGGTSVCGRLNYTALYHAQLSAGRVAAHYAASL